ncbi:hypothetical protein EWB00_001507 [Schistosoma japonicum]|uniref:Uncharacterized protein n=1 Tax=Schistosoma japonicum TaxID=6182 RepID=A0A4Z2DFJ6_SCHJA|nr:hypothetical protein EWB00_001507 [Schistosoma japonicum]
MLSEHQKNGGYLHEELSNTSRLKFNETDCCTTDNINKNSPKMLNRVSTKPLSTAVIWANFNHITVEQGLRLKPGMKTNQRNSSPKQDCDIHLMKHGVRKSQSMDDELVAAAS